MARDKDFKRLVRRRMEATDERYTTARAALRGSPPPPSELDEAVRWIPLLALPDQADEVYARLESLPADICRTVALEGLRHTRWRVRRRCCRLLDDLALTDATVVALKDRLHDDHPGVRQAALHTLVCEGCKPEKCDVDVRGFSELMLSDPNEKVRRQAVGALRSFDDASTVALLTTVAEKDQSARVREFAKELLEDKALREAAAARRLALPPDLKTKTERHAGKWVAIADGLIVSADRFRGQIRRDLKGRDLVDAIVCWVPHDASTP